MEPVRILHIVHTLNRGGMESRIMDLYRNLDHERFQYDFYIESGKCGMFDDEIRSFGGRVYLSQGHCNFNIPDFKAFHKFLVGHPEYRIVYAYNQWSGFYLKEAKKCGVPHRIANARTSIQIKSPKNEIKNLVKLNVNKYATHRFAVSKKAANWLFGKKMLSADQVEIWPNAIDTQKFMFSEIERNEVRKELGLEDAFIVIHVGNIRYEKNHPFLLTVFNEIKKLQPNAKLLLIGGGNIEKLVPQMKDLGIENSVKYLGIREDIPKLLQAGDVFVFPSLYEGFPGAVLEAECSGLPCIISDTITDEVVLTKGVKQLSIKQSPYQWAWESLNYMELDRTIQMEIVRDAGFDIHDLVYQMERLYSQYEKNGVL